MKRARESDGARIPRKRLNGSSRSATCANRSSKPVSYTQAAEATTNNENEPRRAVLNMKPARESDDASTPRKKLNGSSRSATYANRRGKSVSYTQTPTKSFKQINGRRRQAQKAGATNSSCCATAVQQLCNSCATVVQH